MPRNPSPAYERFVACLICAILLATLALPAGAADRVVTVDGDEVPVATYPADGGRLALWIPAEYGVLDAYHEAARSLQADGVESWIADPYTAWFLPVAPSSLEAIPGSLVGALIEAAREATGKQVFLVSHDQGAAVALYGAHRWQREADRREGLGGVVLVSPYLLEGTPEVGEEARYLPVARATNLPLYVLQPERSPLHPRLPELKAALTAGGSDVFTHRLAGLRDRYFFRPDAMGRERTAADELPGLLRNALALLDTQPAARTAVPMAEGERRPRTARSERLLTPYRGDPVPPPLVLKGLDGSTRDLADRRGEVVLVNFWASWCPPCVHEMPSMQRLADRYADRPFTILAVNLAEEEADVRAFVARHELRFPVLLDPAGESIDAWKVFAYPTSYVIDHRGEIRYALFGAIDWLEPEVLETIGSLLDEAG
ncbi:MAG: TlpA family protein disulfide reductase [Gammaproteobacteria bacterium]|nr:TlpA family protein disulfide reductase [Gammaproteobacteria bacterium]